MQLEVRNPDTIAIARDLAERRNASVSDLLHEALLHEWEREKKFEDMREKLRAFHAEVRKLSDPGKGLPADKAFIDSLFGDD